MASDTSLEMRIPKSFVVMVIGFVFSVITVIFSILGVLNLFTLTAVIPSLLWLSFITMVLRSSIRAEGGVRQYLKNWAGELIGHEFVEAGSTEAGEKEIRFGYNVFGHRLIRQTIPCKNITSIGWRTGQATGMSGRDMDDWTVWLGHELEESARVEKERRTGNKVSKLGNHAVGPADKKARTEALGLSFMEFLRQAGVEFVPDTGPNHFVRQLSESKTEATV